MSVMDDLQQAIQKYTDALTSRFSSASLSGVRYELGHSAQQNDGKGIDQGSWYQLDMNIGQFIYGSLGVKNNVDGTAILPAGLYAVLGTARIVANNSGGTYNLPAQMNLATGSTNYPYPGIYQDGVRSFPEHLIEVDGRQAASTISLDTVGAVRMTGTMESNGTNPTWIGFSKVAANNDATLTLSLQGYIEFLKIG